MQHKQTNIVLLPQDNTNMSPSEKCKTAGFDSLVQVSKLSGESSKSLINWVTRYPRRFELILKGLLFERAIVQAESIEEAPPTKKEG